MADNVAISSGSGTSIATDDVAAVHYQRVKLDFGADGAAAPATTATPFPVTIISGANLYVEDAAAAANPTGTALNLIRADTLAAVTTTDGDNVAARGTNNGEVYVKHVDDVNVSGSVNAIQSGTWNTVITPGGSPVATTYLTVRPSDGTNFIAPGQEYTENDVVPANAGVGTLMLARRDDALSALTPAQDDAVGLRVDANGGLWVTQSGTVTVAAHAVTNAGTFVTQENGAGLTSLQLIDDIVGVEDVAETAAAGLARMGAVRRDTLANSAGTTGDNCTVNTTANGALWSAPTAATNGGLTPYTALSTAAVLTAAVKASPGQIYSLDGFNIGAAAVFVRIYNQTGAPASTDTANVIWQGTIPGNTAGAGFVKEWPTGLTCTTGIGVRVTSGIAHNSTGALTADQVQVNIGYA